MMMELLKRDATRWTLLQPVYMMSGLLERTPSEYIHIAMEKNIGGVFEPA